MKRKLLPKLGISFISALLITLPVHADKVYKWVDEEGVTHYGEKAPQDKDYSMVKTYGEVPSDSAEATKKLEEQRANELEAKKKGIDYEEQKRLADNEAKVREENCKSATNNLKTIEENARIRILGDDGEFRYLSDEERQQHLERARDIIANNCDA